MANPVEAIGAVYDAIDQRIPRPPAYPVSVAERTFGIDQFRKLKAEAQYYGHTDGSTIEATQVAIIQTLFPVTLRGIENATFPNTLNASGRELIVKIGGGFIVDLGAIMATVIISQGNIPEAVSLKLGFNATSHAVLDLAGRAFTRLGGIPPNIP